MGPVSTLAVVLVLTWLGGISILLSDFWTQTLTLIKALPKDRLAFTLAGSWGKFITRPHSAFLVGESKLQASYLLFGPGVSQGCLLRLWIHTHRPWRGLRSMDREPWSPGDLGNSRCSASGWAHTLTPGLPQLWSGWLGSLNLAKRGKVGAYLASKGLPCVQIIQKWRLLEIFSCCTNDSCYLCHLLFCCSFSPLASSLHLILAVAL